MIVASKSTMHALDSDDYDVKKKVEQVHDM